MRGSLFLVFVAVLVCLTRAVEADEDETTIVIVHSSVQEALVVHLCAELESLNFKPVPVKREPGSMSRADLEDTARSVGAAAAMRVVPSGRGVDVWVADRVTGKTVWREVVMAKGGDRTNATVALKAVELLRASLMEIHADHEMEGELEPSGVVIEAASVVKDQTAKQKPTRLSLEMEPAVTYGFGELPPTMNLFLGVHVSVAKRFGLDLLGSIPMLAMEIDETEGKADVWIGMIGAGPRIDIGVRGSRWTPSLGSFAGPVFMRMKGYADPPYEDNTDLVVVAAICLRGGLSFAINDTFALRVDVLAGWTMPRPVVRFAGRDVAWWGRPFLGAMIGLDMGLI